ncbi:MAG: hypothetical protein FD134_1877 [Gallionellaceae bacterium]|nr:MAG: hypothetical protein FD134_1877 [Gallionellaceae bacterium]
MSNCNFLPNVGKGTDTCCGQHDKDYAAGSGVARLDADRKLRNCLLENGNPRWLVCLAFWLIRLFGWVFYKNRTRTRLERIRQLIKGWVATYF